MRATGQADSPVTTATPSKATSLATALYPWSVSVPPSPLSDPTTKSPLSLLHSQCKMEDTMRVGLEDSFRSPFPSRARLLPATKLEMRSARATLATTPTLPLSTQGFICLI